MTLVSWRSCGRFQSTSNRSRSYLNSLCFIVHKGSQTLSHYVFTLGAYRALYILNWIYRFFTVLLSSIRGGSRVWFRRSVWISFYTTVKQRSKASIRTFFFKHLESRDKSLFRACACVMDDDLDGRGYKKCYSDGERIVINQSNVSDVDERHDIRFRPSKTSQGRMFSKESMVMY